MEPILLEALKSLAGTSDAKFLADILKDQSINTNDFTSENDDIQIASNSYGVGSDLDRNTGLRSM